MSNEFEWTVHSPLYGEQEKASESDVCLEEHAYKPMVLVGKSKLGKLDAKAKKALGLEDLPPVSVAAESNDLLWLWSGKDQWLVMAKNEKDAALIDFLQESMKGYCLSEQTGSRVYMTLSGEKSRDVLAKLCRLDLDEKAFVEGSVATTNLGHINVHIWREAGKELTFGILVFSSFARSLWHELCGAGLEHGMGIKRFYA